MLPQYNTTCPTCGKEFFAPVWRKRKGEGRYCSCLCAQSHRPLVPATVRFWAKVKKTDGCWLWQGATHNRGHGTFGDIPHHTMPAHRFAWQDVNGPIPNGLFVCHSCDNPPCVRPDHLFLGTAKDNSVDAERKGRLYHGRGEQHYAAKLRDADIPVICSGYACGQSMVALARTYGVTDGTISNVIHHRHWKHLFTS